MFFISQPPLDFVPGKSSEDIGLAIWLRGIFHFHNSPNNRIKAVWFIPPYPAAAA